MERKKNPKTNKQTKKNKGHSQLLQDQRHHIYVRNSERIFVDILLNFFSPQTKVLLIINKIWVSGEIAVTSFQGLFYMQQTGEGMGRI